MSIAESVARCRAHFQTGATIPIDARINALRALEQAILAHEADIYDALKQDLGKSATESYMCEVGLTLAELRYQLRHVRRWAARHRKRTGLANFHASSFTIAEPYGCVLIMSPWNYPFMLTMEPLVGALAAGNVCVVKPSAYSPATSAVMRKIIASCLPEELVCVVEGGRAENTALLDQTFDYIFFTGGTTVGRLVMQKAAEHLTPITLELGGKSPCIIAKDANLKVAAARVVFGKYLNCGQTCVAPDYILVDEQVHDAFLHEVRTQITSMYGTHPLDNPDWGHIVNEKHLKRLMGLIDPAKVVFGGDVREETLQIAPTIMDNVTAENAVMGEEIFGPIMPIISTPPSKKRRPSSRPVPSPWRFICLRALRILSSVFSRMYPLAAAA